MKDLRNVDDYWITPWMGFPCEESPLMKGSLLLFVIVVFWSFVLFVLKNMIQNFATSSLFKSLVPMLIDIYTYTFQWGWLVAIAFSLWRWEQLRFKKFKKVMG